MPTLHTQTWVDLGMPYYNPLGIMFVEIEPTIASSGQGVTKDEGMKRLEAAINEKYGEDAIVLNLRVSFHSGTCHPSYGTYRIRAIGDLYCLA